MTHACTRRLDIITRIIIIIIIITIIIIIYIYERIILLS